MITYPVRDATDHPLECFADLSAAVTAVDAACHAHTYNPSTLPGSKIHRIVTADLNADDVGDILYGRIECVGDRADENQPAGLLVAAAFVGPDPSKA